MKGIMTVKELNESGIWMDHWVSEKTIQLCGKGFNRLFGKASYTYFSSIKRNGGTKSQ